MNCPSCSTPLEPGARFCGVCGHRLEAAGQRTPAPSGMVGVGAKPQAAAKLPGSAPKIAPIARTQTPAAGNPVRAAGSQPETQFRPSTPAGTPKIAGGGGLAPAASGKPKASIGQKPRGPAKPPDADMYIGHLLNGRFRIDSKIGEGGFGAVYRGIQLQTGRKVALKLLHPEMTNDENLVARFRREGLVLCNLKDAHTITTYDFDQTPDGTLYIAMELLEGRSLHQVFHDEAPVDWRRMFKILIEMCSSLAEAHASGIVHRDLKPENIYLEARPGNPEFVKILDFGIAKVMRGEGSMDPQAPQLTATGQTLGTLEYMSPEQLMGKPLDGRSDVYALGVLAYELITGRLPFPDAKGPAGLITAQLKQTPKPPSQVNPSGNVPISVDKVLLKCLEKDKNNRHADVTHLMKAAQAALNEIQPAAGTPKPGADALTTHQGQPANLQGPPAMPVAPMANIGTGPIGQGQQGQQMQHGQGPGPGGHLHGGANGPGPGPGYGPGPGPHAPVPQPIGPAGSAPHAWNPGASYNSGPVPATSTRWVWFALGLLVLGAVTGAVLAYAL